MICSIITVNYNDHIGLKRTLESVRKQNFSDFEHIIIDGGSTDGSVNVITSYVNSVEEISRNNVIWSSEKDTGVFNAMNKGIKSSHGDYLLFLNSGDYLVNESVLQEVFSTKRNSDFIIGKCQVSKDNETIWIAYPQNDYTLDYFFHGSMAHQASFIKKSLFDDYGFYREDLKIMSDWEFSLKTIIFGRASVEPIDVLISDYNCDGMSSDSRNKAIIEKERRQVFFDLHLNHIVPDYAERDNVITKQEAMLWAWNKKCFRRPIEFVYRVARKFKI